MFKSHKNERKSPAEDGRDRLTRESLANLEHAQPAARRTDAAAENLAPLDRVDPALVQRIRDLVVGVELDLDAPLAPGDE